MLIEKIRKDRMAAMKARDVVGKTLLTTLLGELESAAKRTGDEITDAIVIAACKKFIAGNDEVIEASDDLGIGCPNLRAENVLLETFIPTQLTEADLYELLPKTDAKNFGEAMQYLKANHAGLYDGKLAFNIAKHIYG